MVAHVRMSDKLSFHIPLGHQAVNGTWSTDPRFEALQSLPGVHMSTVEAFSITRNILEMVNNRKSTLH